MRLTKSIYSAPAIALVAVFVIASFAFAGSPKAARLLEKADKLAVDAQKTDGNVEQARKFNGAVKAYRDAINADRDSPEAAEAQLTIGKIYAGVPIDSTADQPFRKVYQTRMSKPIMLVFPHEGTLQDDYMARDQFREIGQKFGRPQEQIVEDYGPEDAKRIISVVDQAKNYYGLVSARVDRSNKHKTLYRMIDSLVALTGRVPWFSYWFAILLITVIVKLLITPLTKAQFKSMREMQQIQPLIKELQAKYKGDQGEIGKRTMELYKEHGINPLMGCLPLLAQFPVLYLVYTMIRYYEIQFANGTFLWVGWKATENIWTLHLPFGGRPVYLTAPNLAQPDLPLLVLYTISMILSQKISVVDPTQAEQQKMMTIMMPIMFFLLIGWLPSAFVLYWLLFNVLQTWQQYHIIHGAGGRGGSAPAVAPTPPPTPPQRRSSGRRRRRR